MEEELEARRIREDPTNRNRKRHSTARTNVYRRRIYDDEMGDKIDTDRASK